MAENKPSLSQTVPTQPQEPKEPVPKTETAGSTELEAREKDVAERERRADEVLARAEAIAKSVEDRLKSSQAAAQPAAVLEASNTEKANIVTLLLNKAFADKDLGPVKSFTPSVTLSNNTEAGLIVFEQDVEYQLPQAIIEDLEGRQKTYLRYKESVNIRSVVNQEVGQISGAGK